MVLIENEGALFRGPARGLPQERWSPRSKAWVPYAGGDKDIDWGHVIDDARAEELKAEK